MKAQIILFASAVLMVCSCQKENLAEVSTAKNSIVATIEEDTKTTVAGTNVTWKENDQIDIAYYNSGIKNVTYKLDNTYADQKQGVFTGDEISFTGNCYAVYPNTTASYVSGDVKFVFSTPSTQEAAENVGKYMQMYTAAFKMGDKVKFQHLSCALKVTINPSSETTISNIVVEYSSGSVEYPSRNYTITNGVSSVSGKTSNKVTLNINEKISGPKDYYIALAPKSSSTCKWTVTVHYGTSSKQVTIDNTLEAGKLYTGSFNL